jgi:predicted DNA-binding antitoxin AbrB/MazE fold protein
MNQMKVLKKLILQDGVEVDIDECLQDISGDLAKSRKEMIKVIQKKLR